MTTPTDDAAVRALIERLPGIWHDIDDYEKLPNNDAWRSAIARINAILLETSNTLSALLLARATARDAGLREAAEVCEGRAASWKREFGERRVISRRRARIDEAEECEAAIRARIGAPADEPSRSRVLEIQTCPKCGAKAVAFICSERGCPVNGGAAYG